MAFRGHRVGCMCSHSAFPRRDVWWTKGEFCFTTPKTSPPCGRSFCPCYYLEGTNEFIPEEHCRGMSCPRVRRACAPAGRDAGGSKVRLYVPQRGDTAQGLVEMARTNAVERLARESGRYAREQKHLDELAALLGSKEPPRDHRELRHLQLGRRQKRGGYGGV